MAVGRVVNLAVHAAVDRVDQSIALAAFGILEERRRQNAFAAGRERDLDRIVHATGHDGFHNTAFASAPENVRGARDKFVSAGLIKFLLRPRAFAPIDPAVEAEVRAVQIVGATGHCAGIDPFLAFVGDAIAIGVGEFQNRRHRGDVERTVQPQRAFGKWQLVGERHGAVEHAVAVGVFQAHDAVRFFL